jgi:glycosyltransferase involved in cell wall biosynthesis
MKPLQTGPEPGAPPSAASPTRAPAGLRVLVVAPQPFFTDRGTPIATRHLLKALCQLGYRPDVLTYPQGGSPEIPGVRVFRVPNVARLRHVPIGFSWRKTWLDLFLFAALSRRLGEDEYVCVSAVEESAFLAALVAPRFGVPVIYDMQCSLAEQMSRLWPLRNPLAARALEGAERWLVNRVRLTMTSAGLAERVRHVSPEARVREWRYPGSMETVAAADVDRLRAELGLAGKERVVLYAGNFAPYQGVPDLIEAMPAVLAWAPDVTLVLVGADGGADEREVRRLSSRLPRGAVRILERKPHSEIPALLALADVLVSPRLYGNNLPLKVIEYLASGRPIVATSIAAHRTVLNGERAELVDVGPEALAMGIVAVLEDSVRRHELGRRAREFARSHLDWLGYVHGVGEVFGEVCLDDRPS